MTHTPPQRHLFLTTEIFYPDQIGGGLLQFTRYASALREHGIIVHVCTALRPHHCSDSEEWNSVHILRFPDCTHENHHVERELIVDKTLALIAEDYTDNGCIQPNGETWVTTIALAKARFHGIPATFYFSMFPPEIDRKGWSRFKAIVHITLCLLPFRRLIFCSEALGRAFGSLGLIAESRKAFIPNGVNLEHFSPVGGHEERKRIRQDLGLPQEGNMILYVGGFMERKGSDLLVKAWAQIEKQHPDAFLVFVGSQGMRQTFRDPSLHREMEAFQSSMIHLVEDLESRGRIRMVGEVENVSNYYRAANLFAFPSRREGLPNAVLEAMSSGLPCLLAPFHGFPEDGEEFGTHGSEFRRIPHEVDCWASAIAETLHDANGREKMGSKARQWMEQTQAWDITVSKLATIYQNLLK